MARPAVFAICVLLSLFLISTASAERAGVSNDDDDSSCVKAGYTCEGKECCGSLICHKISKRCNVQVIPSELQDEKKKLHHVDRKDDDEDENENDETCVAVGYSCKRKKCCKNLKCHKRTKKCNFIPLSSELQEQKEKLNHVERQTPSCVDVGFSCMGREKCCRGLSCDKSTKRCKVKITPSDLQKQKDKLKNVRKDDDSTCLEAGESCRDKECCGNLKCHKISKRCTIRVTPSELQENKEKLKHVKRNDDDDEDEDENEDEDEESDDDADDNDDDE